jgi:hypothetical protein
MLIRLPLVAAAVLAVALLALAGCAKPATSSAPVALAPVPIANFMSVAGTWEGLVRGVPARGSSREDDFVDVVITPDGTYDFGIYRTVGMFGGTGKLAIENGLLVVRGERGSATLTLLEGGGRRVLRADGLMRNGVRLSADLTPRR